MKSFRSAILLLVCVLVAGTAFAQGRGRIEGKIVDEQGQPVAEVLIRAQKMGSPDEMAETKSNAKGEFTLQRVSDGQWRVEFQREGLEAEPATIEVAKNRAPALTVTMAKPVDPMVVINNELKRAAGLMQSGDITGARAIYEELYAKYPQPFQFPFAIATTYAAEKNFEKALEFAKIAAEKDPASVDVKMLTAEIHVEAGNRAEALAILDAIDLKEVQDPVMFINAGIILINDKKRMKRSGCSTACSSGGPISTRSTTTAAGRTWPVRRSTWPKRISRSLSRWRRPTRRKWRTPSRSSPRSTRPRPRRTAGSTRAKRPPYNRRVQLHHLSLKASLVAALFVLGAGAAAQPAGRDIRPPRAARPGKVSRSTPGGSRQSSRS
jgi:Flp pilus assembly protein TadD